MPLDLTQTLYKSSGAFLLQNKALNSNCFTMLLLRKPRTTFISPQIKTKFQFPPQVSIDTAKFFWISRQMTNIKKKQKQKTKTKVKFKKKKTTPNSKIIWNVVSKPSPCQPTKGRASKLRGQEPGGVQGAAGAQAMHTHGSDPQHGVQKGKAQSSVGSRELLLSQGHPEQLCVPAQPLLTAPLHCMQQQATHRALSRLPC